jgi:hypothetical protein
MGSSEVDFGVAFGVMRNQQVLEFLLVGVLYTRHRRVFGSTSIIKGHLGIRGALSSRFFTRFCI